jgi:Polyketide cyclase / dehydrase and lipid transport
MPSFHDAADSPAPPEEVWKLLYDPARFPEWWVGVETVEPGEDGYTMYPDGYPDFPMPQALRTDSDDRGVRISCLVSDLQFSWRLAPAGDAILGGMPGTRITVDVEIPESEAHRLDGQREAVHASLQRLAALAATA